MRHMLFRQHQKPDQPVRRDELNKIIQNNYKARRAPWNDHVNDSCWDAPLAGSKCLEEGLRERTAIGGCTIALLQEQTVDGWWGKACGSGNESQKHHEKG